MPWECKLRIQQFYSGKREVISESNTKLQPKMHPKFVSKIAPKSVPKIARKKNLNSRLKISPQISPVFRQFLRLHVWDVLEHSVQYFLQIVSQTHQLKPTIDMCCKPSSGRTAGFHQLKGLVWWDRWGPTANWTMKWHGVRGRAPGSNSLDRIAIPRVNTAPKPPKTNKTHFSEFFSQK